METTRKCPYCAEIISREAIKCKHCGEILDNDLRRNREQAIYAMGNQQTERLWHPGIAAVLSLVIPGAGQLYKGNILAGVLWLRIVPLGYIFFIIPGLLLHLICIITAASGNPYKLS